MRADDGPGRQSELRDAIRLALLPIGVAVVLGLLLLPRRVPPDGMPLPIPDEQSLARSAQLDGQLAERARRDPLPGPVRALGSAVRAFHTLEARQADSRELGAARGKVDAALIEASQVDGEALLGLRAVQLEGFLAEVRRFETTGDESDELVALAGGFVRAMRAEGWCDGRRLSLREPALRAMFKQMWNAFLGFEARKGFEPSLDEQRALYAFYLSHPHPSQAMRVAIGAARRGARDARACRAAAEAERAAVEAWRLERVARLAAIDPSYPAAYARGVGSFRRGDYAASVDAFRAWLLAHPDGPLTLRAQNYLRAASDAARKE